MPRLEVEDLASLRPSEYGQVLRAWLHQHGDQLRTGEGPALTFPEQLRRAAELQRRLYDVGWGRVGWPAEVGGSGGTAIHRAVLYDELSRAGLPSRSAFEHLEILAPPLVRHWSAEQLRRFMPAFLRGDEVWCQGFSEPDAGSDLAALRTTARRDGDVYVLAGQKVWTSWATEASRCVVLARTGTPEERHRGISAFFVDLDASGVEVRAIRQANGVDELAEVLLDNVAVPLDRRIGPEGGGWTLAMDILTYERAVFAWLRSATLFSRADALTAGPAGDASALGDALLSLYALRMSSADAVRRLESGEFKGAEAARVKVVLADAEQQLHDYALDTLGAELVQGSHPEAASWQQHYLFSRAVSIYGGTRQMNLSTIAKLLLDLR